MKNEDIEGREVWNCGEGKGWKETRKGRDERMDIKTREIIKH
jgi:hypothetical protein